MRYISRQRFLRHLPCEYSFPVYKKVAKRQAGQVNELAWLIETGNAEAAFNEDIQVADVKGM